MQVVLNATSFRLSDDTESTKETPGIVKFLEHHKVPFTRYVSPETVMNGVTVKEEKRVQWKASESKVYIRCSTIEELQEYCIEYQCSFSLHSYCIIITFE